MQLDLHYTDALLVSVYDIENAGRHDIDFYLEQAHELGAVSAIDLGCGTGVLAVDLAAAGVKVTGVDPAVRMLQFARTRPGGDRVRWVEGDSSVLETESADLVVMTGHAAQVLLTDDAWTAMIRDVRRALRPGGHLAFEVRNPDAKAWLRWTRQHSHGSFRLPAGGHFESWVEVTGVRGDLVSFEGHNLFSGRLPGSLPAPGGDLVVPSTLRFRTQAQVSASLISAGFEVPTVYGDWDRSPVGSTSSELIFLAQRP